MRSAKNDIIDTDNIIKNILFMYYDMVKTYNGFGNSIDVGQFDPILVITTNFDDGDFDSDDIALLLNGSGIALLLLILDVWDELNDLDAVKVNLDNVYNVFIGGKFDSLNEDILLAIKLSFSHRNNELFKMLPGIYNKYVLGFFKNLTRLSNEK